MDAQFKKERYQETYFPIIISYGDVGYGTISSHDGLPRVGISYHAHVNPKYRGKGYGSLLHQQRLIWAASEEANLDYLICTVNAENEAQKYILKKFGWKELDKFFNECTCNEVIIYGKNLRK